MSSAQEENEPSYYIYHGEHEPLRLDTGVVAVKFANKSPNMKSASASSLSTSLTAQGFAASDILDKSMPGWSFLSTKRQQAGSVASRANKDWSAVALHTLIRSVLESGDPNVSFVSPVFRDENGGPIIITSRLLIGFQPGFTGDARARLRSSLRDGASLEKVEFPQPDSERWQLSSRDGFAVLAHANALASTPGVAYAEPDMFATGYANFFPNDSQFSQSWGLRNTGAAGGVAGFDMAATSAWSLTLGQPSVLVLVLDCGVQENHPDLSFATGRDFTSDSASHPGGGPLAALDNHGTWVAGCIAERINNSLGTSGIAPGARIVSARCHNQVKSDESFSFLESSVVDALEWGQSLHARISNNSNSYGVKSVAIDQAYARTRANGMVHFASVGNDARPRIDYPSISTSVNAVGSVSRNGRRSSFSNYGICLAFMAPGDQIYTTDRTGAAGESNTDYMTVSGTSFASPYAAGVAALILSKNPLLSVAQVESRIRHNCTNIGPAGYDTGYGYGLINAYKALSDSRIFPINNCLDFDADGRADIAVFRPSNRVWYFNRSTSGFGAVTFGAGTDQLVPADYDGDGKTDVAVFRPSTGNWYILQSATALTRVVHLGGLGDKALPGDFDGDGRADIAVFHPGSSYWSILQSRNNEIRTEFFSSTFGTIPIVGDFDGDGRSDPGYFHPDNGFWYYLRSSDAHPQTVFFGQSGDIPTVGDYDGDGKSDLAVFRPSNGVWSRKSSLNGYTYSRKFGVSGDQPIAADYDGDGKTDLAVRRGATFFVLHSTNNFVTTTTFGLSTDIALGAAYNR